MGIQRICSVDGCDKPFHARDRCRSHHACDLRAGALKPVRDHAKRGLGPTLVRAALQSETDACITWPYAQDGRGYAISYVGRRIRVHRYVCTQAHGQPAEESLACHRCGNSLCINPRHLYWGTPQDNADDCVRHGTNSLGERHSHSRLTAKIVADLRRQPITVSHASLAEELGVSETTVRNARNRVSWRHVA